MRHLDVHFPTKGFECPLCTLVCPNENTLKQHVSDHIGGKWHPNQRDSRKNSVEDRGGTDPMGGLNKSPQKCKSKLQKPKGKSPSNYLSRSPEYPYKKKSPKSYEHNDSANTSVKYGSSSYMNFYNNIDKNLSLDSNYDRERSDSNSYDPIDPLNTTNKSLSYSDFYKKQNFMSNNRPADYSNGSQFAVNSKDSDSNGHKLHYQTNYSSCQSEPLSLIVRQGVSSNPMVPSSSYANAINLHR